MKLFRRSQTVSKPQLLPANELGFEIRHAGDYAHTFRLVGCAGYRGTRVAGVPHHLPAVAKAFRQYGLPPRERMDISAILRREPNNPYDPNAIAVYIADAQVGYVPQEIATRYTPHLDGLLADGWSAIEVGANLYRMAQAEGDGWFAIDLWIDEPIRPLANVPATPREQPLIFMQPWESTVLERISEQEDRVANFISSTPELTTGASSNMWGLVFSDAGRIAVGLPNIGMVGYTHEAPGAAEVVRKISHHGQCVGLVSVRVLKTKPARVTVRLDNRGFESIAS